MIEVVIELKGFWEYLGVKHNGFALYRERKLKQVIPFHSLKGVKIAKKTLSSLVEDFKVIEMLFQRKNNL
ncbi:hypothetical protein ACFLY8_02160 [Halobacteriota archaeon]